MGKVNRNYSKTQACLELVDIRKSKTKARLEDLDFAAVAKKYSLSLQSVKRSWQNFTLYGKPSLEFQSAGLACGSDSQKQAIAVYMKGFNYKSANHNIDDFSKILKEFIFGEWKSIKDFTNEYKVTADLIYNNFRSLDSTGQIYIGGKKENRKTVLTFESPDGHGKPFPVREAIRWQRFQNKKKKYPSLKLPQYATLDKIKEAQYKNILAVLKEWL